jgi:hypothetical protein
MRQIKFTTNDNIIFNLCEDSIVVDGELGGYRKIGDEEGYFFYSDKLDTSAEERIAFENRVMELIYNVKAFEESVDECVDS